MKPHGTTEFALLINFDSDMNAYIPLGSPHLLGDEDFPIPVSIIHGDNDWVGDIDNGASAEVIQKL